jgi:hypothetical protein
MNDDTEALRELLLRQINSEIKSDDKQEERARLEKKYGKGNVFSTEEIKDHPIIQIIQFTAPLVIVQHKETKKLGNMMFQHYPRFYFGLEWDK